MLLITLLLTGCADEPVAFSDSIDLTFDLGFVGDSDEQLHQPYVQGADMGFNLRHRRGREVVGWEVVSMDERIFSLSDCAISEEQDLLSCDAAALSEGVAEVVVFNEDGDEIGATDVEVAMPDRVELLPHGPLIIDRLDLIVEGTPQVLVGGTSTWLARYYLGDTRLYGNGALSVESTAGFDAWTEDSFLLEDRDWLQGTALQAGTHTVPVLVDGVYIHDVEFEAVTEEVIDRVELYGMDESVAEFDDNLVLLAQSYDTEDRPVYAVEFVWDFDGIEGESLGDLYRYNYDADYPVDVGASIGDVRAEVSIHGEGTVDSTNDVGCSALSGSAGLAGVLVGLLGVLRRRDQIPGPTNT